MPASWQAWTITPWMPVGPSYMDRSAPYFSRTAASPLLSEIGTGRECGLSESRAPSTMTSSGSATAMSADRAAANDGHRKLGSGPCLLYTSDAADDLLC